MRPTIEVLVERMAAAGVALAAEHLEIIARVARQQFVPVGTRLVTEGEDTGTLYIVCDGELRVTTAGGGELAQCGVGTIAGEVAILDHGPATASLTASEDATVLALDRATLDQLRVDHPRTASALLQALCETLARRVRETTDMLEVISTEGSAAPPTGGFLVALRSLFGLGARAA